MVDLKYKIVKNELSYLIDRKREESGPFHKNMIEKYYEMYENIANLQKN